MDTSLAVEYHTYEPARGHGLKHDPFLAIVGPRPIGWIGSIDERGRANLAPYSFFNAFCDEPPIVGFCSNGWKDSVRNIQETGQFTWNLATRRLAEQMNLTATALQHGGDEFEFAGLPKASPNFITAPCVADSPVSFECRMTQIIRLTDSEQTPIPAWMIFGEVIAVHIDRRCIRDGVYDTSFEQPVLRAGGDGEYFEILRAGKFRMAYPEPG